MGRPDKAWETTLYYAWLHIKTGKERKKSIILPYPRTIAIERLDELILNWNKQQPKHWEYKRITRE
jgi:hypothetical protein